MVLEQRDRIKQLALITVRAIEEDNLSTTKPFVISKSLVMAAYKRVKANRGAAGVDQQSLEQFDLKLKDNLYKIWNRMSCGNYFPPAVRAVPIPKKSGGERILGIPTVADRIAQMVVKMTFEPLVEPHFHPDSYGYRPHKSALDAVGVVRQRCWKNDWVLEFDIKGLFDNIDHDLLMKAVMHHTKEKWVILYIRRWLTAPMQMPDGTCIARTQGTPQGGVISPVLSNLFLHYVFDAWMGRKCAGVEWCRYADDGVVHCKSEGHAKYIKSMLEKRFEECLLELHPLKTKIVYCKDTKRKLSHPETCFTFLGYDFRRRTLRNPQTGGFFLGFTPAVSKSALKSMHAELRSFKIPKKTRKSLPEIAKELNPIIRGWIGYYGCYTRAALDGFKWYIDDMLTVWAMRKYKKLAGRITAAGNFIKRIKSENPKLFAHWV